MSDLRIQSLEAKYVGPFEHLFIEFKEKPEAQRDEAEVHIFTGENGTGKSTILYLLTAYPNYGQILPRIQQNRLEDFSIETKYRYLSNIESIQVPTFQSITFQHRNGRFRFNGINENVDAIGRYFNDGMRNFNYFKNSFALFAYSGYRRVDNYQVTAIQELTNSPLRNALDFTNSIEPNLLIQWIANVKTKQALAFTKSDFDKARKYELTLQKIEIAVSEIIGYSIEFGLEGDPLGVYVKINESKISFESLPDGLKSIISWMADLLMKMDRIKWQTEEDIFDRNFILFLDEIDVHLHPSWQRKILPVVKKLFKNAQIFISTHSPFVIGSVDGAWVYKLKKEGQYAVLDGEPVLSEDANSYRYILEETFGIKAQFGEAVENKLKRFYEFRDKILKGELPFNDNNFQSLIDDLAGQTIEVESIIGMELRQLKRLTSNRENIHA